jgi:hypothetical protein
MERVAHPSQGGRAAKQMIPARAAISQADRARRISVFGERRGIAGGGDGPSSMAGSM